MRFFNHRRHGHVSGRYIWCISPRPITARSTTWDSVRISRSASKRIGRAGVLLYWLRSPSAEYRGGLCVSGGGRMAFSSRG